MRDYRYRMAQIYQLATESRTGFYPVNTVRKMSLDRFAAEEQLDGGPENLPQVRMDPFETTWHQVSRHHREIARATGGVPVFQRDPLGYLGDQLDTTAGVYTVSYYPSELTTDRRRVKIKVSRKGAKVVYRSTYRHVQRSARRLEGELLLETSPEELARGIIRARLKVAGAEFAVAPESEPPASLASLYFELTDARNRPVQDLYEVIAFPRGERRRIARGTLERPFALMVPPGDYVLRVDIHDVHGPGWGSFSREISAGTPPEARREPAAESELPSQPDAAGKSSSRGES
jgi:hypothetical protein